MRSRRGQQQNQGREQPEVGSTTAQQVEHEGAEADSQSEQAMAEVERIAGSDRSGMSAPSHSGQVEQASEAPLLVVMAALAMAPSATSQTATLSGPAPAAGRKTAGRRA